jgi:RNA polymerase sigma factor (sigma-70 family)
MGAGVARAGLSASVGGPAGDGGGDEHQGGEAEHRDVDDWVAPQVVVDQVAGEVEHRAGPRPSQGREQRVTGEYGQQEHRPDADLEGALHHAAHRIEDRTRAAAYLRSIVLNLARDHNRRGLMSLRHFEALTPAASPEAIDDRIVLNEQQAAVVEALQTLSPEQRDCLVLRFYLELSEKEAADTLGISPNSVKTHCRRGFDRLRTRLEGRT